MKNYRLILTKTLVWPALHTFFYTPRVPEDTISGLYIPDLSIAYSAIKVSLKKREHFNSIEMVTFFVLLTIADNIYFFLQKFPSIP